MQCAIGEVARAMTGQAGALLTKNMGSCNTSEDTICCKVGMALITGGIAAGACYIMDTACSGHISAMTIITVITLNAGISRSRHFYMGLSGMTCFKIIILCSMTIYTTTWGTHRMTGCITGERSISRAVHMAVCTVVFMDTADDCAGVTRGTICGT